MQGNGQALNSIEDWLIVRKSNDKKNIEFNFLFVLSDQ